VVTVILQSPAHRLLSGSSILIRYLDAGGGETTVVARYADTQHGLVVPVAEPDEATWWRQFTTMGQAQVLVRGDWTPMTAHALVGADDPDAVIPLLRAYAGRSPKLAKRLTGDDLEQRIAGAVVVWLRPVH